MNTTIGPKLSDALYQYTGANPFGDSQGREYADTKVITEFFPTSNFWSRFNSQHEILVGSRGSGKTFLLRMMSYSCLRRLQDDAAKQIIRDKTYIGFYLPLHLEFMASVEGGDGLYAKRTGYFCFAFNCAAVMSLLENLQLLIRDTFVSNEDEQILKENALTKVLSALWFPGEESKYASLLALQTRVNQLFYQQPKWLDDAEVELPIFAEECLRPIRFALGEINAILGIDPDNTSWLACVDEAEFVKEPFLKCINTALRSAKRPLVVKLATLPFKHTTRETNVEGACVEPRGNDFNYRLVDLIYDSEDFAMVTNNLCRNRLAGIVPEPVDSLEAFLGTIGKDTLIDYFRLEMGDLESSEEVILRNIYAELSEARQRHAAKSSERGSTLKPIYNRFYPVYFTRRLKRESMGNRVVGWFAGARVCRMVADGNPRRFIQLMNDLFEGARVQELNPKRQHRILRQFCERALVDAQGLPEMGNSAKELLKAIGSRLALRVHGDKMLDGGCGFVVNDSLLVDKRVAESLKLCIAYSHVIFPNVAEGAISENDEMRLSFIHAVNYWLPMRKGDLPKLRAADEAREETQLPGDTSMPLTKGKSRDFVRGLQLHLFDDAL